MDYLVSIIVPTYNACEYIQQTISSVLFQTYHNWELLIIDDCSSDNTISIVKEFAESDPRIRYFSTNQNTGSPSQPRNIGIEQAKGDYIAFLDSDDIWLPNKLEEQLAFMQEYGYDFVYSNYEKMSWDGKREQRIVKVKGSASYKDILKTNEIPCLTVLLRRELLNDVRFKSVPDEDCVCWLDILKKGYRAYNTGKVHAVYREAKQSRSSNKFKMFKERWYILREIEKVGFVPAVYYLTIYAFRGLAKYLV